MAVATRNTRRNPLRALATVALLTLVGFSPSVAWYVSQQYQRTQVAAAPTTSWSPLPSAPVTLAVAHAYAPRAAAYEAALDASKISARRRVRLLEEHFALYRHAVAVIGTAQANALLRMIELETRNQAVLERQSVFSSPDAALLNAQRWLAFTHHVLHDVGPADARLVSVTLQTESPVPMAPDVVANHAKWIKRAANRLHVPVGVVAAIVDTEQAGQSLAYGLSGLLRSFTDTAALRTAEVYGESGMAGEFSKTVGLAQMSWEDAILQERRLNAYGVRFGVPFPKTEGEARSLLARPYANLLLTSSRLVGYLNHARQQPAASTKPVADAWTYFEGPGWHNNPALASSGQTWPYAWNAFFKACLYQRLLAAPPGGEQNRVARQD